MNIYTYEHHTVSRDPLLLIGKRQSTGPINPERTIRRIGPGKTDSSGVTNCRLVSGSPALYTSFVQATVSLSFTFLRFLFKQSSESFLRSKYFLRHFVCLTIHDQSESTSGIPTRPPPWLRTSGLLRQGRRKGGTSYLTHRHHSPIFFLTSSFFTPHLVLLRLIGSRYRVPGSIWFLLS